MSLSEAKANAAEKSSAGRNTERVASVVMQIGYAEVGLRLLLPDVSLYARFLRCVDGLRNSRFPDHFVRNDGFAVTGYS